MDWYKRYIGDYQRDTGRLSITQHGAYCLLLDHYYATEEPLPSELAELYRVCRAMSKSEQKAVRFVADKFFPFRNGSRRNSRADSEVDKARKASNLLRENGIKGAEKRWGGHSEANGVANGEANRGANSNPTHLANGQTMASQTPDSRLKNKNSVPPVRVNPARELADHLHPGRRSKTKPQADGDQEADRVQRALTLLKSDPKCTLHEAAKMCHVSVDAIREAQRT